MAPKGPVCRGKWGRDSPFSECFMAEVARVSKPTWLEQKMSGPWAGKTNVYHHRPL